MSPVSPSAAQALSVENLFLARMQANFDGAKGRTLRGTVWEAGSDDEGDALRALMASRRMYDRELLKQLPHNRRVVLRGYERRWWFRRRATGTAIASVLCPLEGFLDGAGTTRPVGPNDLAEHLRRIAPQPGVQHIIGVCAPTGFTDDARKMRVDHPNTHLVLIEPTSAGGWRLTAGDNVPPAVVTLFDPEDMARKIERVQQAVEQRSGDLLTGGVSAETLAKELDLPAQVVNEALQRVADEDPELHVARNAGDMLLYRGAASWAKERRTMGLVDRIKELFSREGQEASKINMLSERRAALAQRRDRLYEDIGKLEQREQDLLTQGRENKSPVVRRRLAAQVAQLRKDLTRLNTSANMLNQQINIISTDIHNLTLIQQGQSAALPDTEELTQNAVRAEEMLETLKADAELVSGLETGLGEMLTSDTEREILAEFEAPEASASPGEAARSATSTPPARQSQPADPHKSVAPPTAEKTTRKAGDPEAS